MAGREDWPLLVYFFLALCVRHTERISMDSTLAASFRHFLSTLFATTGIAGGLWPFLGRQEAAAVMRELGLPARICRSSEAQDITSFYTSRGIVNAVSVLLYHLRGDYEAANVTLGFVGLSMATEAALLSRVRGAGGKLERAITALVLIAWGAHGRMRTSTASPTISLDVRPWHAVPLLIAAMMLLTPFWHLRGRSQTANAMLALGLPDEHAHSLEAQAVFHLYDARCIGIALTWLTLYAQARYETLDSFVALLGLSILVESSVLARTGQRDKAILRAVTGALTALYGFKSMST